MRLEITEKAEADLEAIGDYIALDNIGRAFSFIEEIRARCEKILNAPLGAPLYESVAGELRKVPFGSYLIFYRLEAQTVFIVRVLHSAQKMEGMLSDE